MTGLRTPLDRAHDAAHQHGADDAAMARFYALLVETPLMVPVHPVAEDSPISPQVFDLSTGPVALAFDADERMTAFFEGPVEYVALTGRSLVEALAGQGLGLALNLGEAPSATLLDAETIRWVAAEMGGEVDAMDLGGALTLSPPGNAPHSLLAALAERVAQMPGLVQEAWLVTLTPETAEARLALLLLPGTAARRAVPGVVTALSRAAAVHGSEAGSVAVGVLDEVHPLLAPARRTGLALHPPPDQTAPRARTTGDAPPRLR
jgi:hypothetical protein